MRARGPAVIRCDVANETRGLIDLRVRERGHERASVKRDGAMAQHVVIPVPPGDHEYAVELKSKSVASCAAFRAVARLGHASDEEQDLEGALTACEGGRSPSLCAVASGLAGRDEKIDDLARSEGVPAPVIDLARSLLRVEGYDGAALLESLAAAGDRRAFARLESAAEADPDDAIAAAFARVAGVLTSLVPIASPSDAPQWTIERDSAACKGEAGSDAGVIGDAEVRVDATPWRSSWAFHLAVDAPCSAAAPIVLAVDGDELRAEPSASNAAWTIVVPRPRATVRRMDRGPGTVRLSSSVAREATNDECAIAPLRARGFVSAADSPTLSFAAPPGLEVWLREGTTSAALRLEPKGFAPIDVSAKVTETSGTALDPAGARWRRAGRVPLPASSAGPIVVRGGPDVVVRGLERVVRSAERAVPAGRPNEPAEPLDEARLADLSKSIRSGPADKRGALHRERAKLLAHAGEAKAAMEDALVAQSLGAIDDADAFVRAELRSRVATIRPFGVDPDFEPNAKRCSKDDSSPRARIAALDADAHKASAGFDLGLAAKAHATAPPGDPRLPSIEARSLAGSRWRELRSTAAAQRVVRPTDPKRELPIAGDGLLRVRALLGSIADSVAVTTQRPAKVALPARSPRARVDFTCVARAPSKADRETCPLEIVADGTTLPAVAIGPGGRGTITIEAGARSVELRMRASPGEWGALAQVVFDRKMPGTRHDPAVGFVLETPQTDRRFLVAPGRPLDLDVPPPALLRVNAWPEAGDVPTIVVVSGRTERTIPVDGSPVIVPVVDPGLVRIEAKTGSATVDVFERVADPSASPRPEPTPRAVPDVTKREAAPAPFAPAGAWRDAAEAIRPPPDGPTSWATLHAVGAIMSSNWREGAALDAPDTFAQQALFFRRRFSSIGLWATAGGLVRERSGDPSAGGRVALFEDIARVRLLAAADVFAQEIEQRGAATVKPRAFAEYAWRVTPSFTIFPRLGFDGWYTTLPVRPIGARQIDDDVYSPTRFFRRSLPYAQAMTWWSPAFDLAVYGRVRGMVDAERGDLASASARAGALVSLGAVDLGAHGDATWFAATPDARATSGIDIGAGGHVATHFWLLPGSAALEPSVGGAARVADARWQVYAALGLVLGHGRRRHDFASLDLGFFDSFAGGTLYRGSASAASP